MASMPSSRRSPIADTNVDRPPPASLSFARPNPSSKSKASGGIAARRPTTSRRGRSRTPADRCAQRPCERPARRRARSRSARSRRLRCATRRLRATGSLEWLAVKIHDRAVLVIAEGRLWQDDAPRRLLAANEAAGNCGSGSIEAIATGSTSSPILWPPFGSTCPTSRRPRTHSFARRRRARRPSTPCWTPSFESFATCPSIRRR
jgi:hypothetical protein